jgi:diguanylate cyclase (GGDEF)-like protein
MKIKIPTKSQADEAGTFEFNEKQEINWLLTKRTFLPGFSKQLEALFLLSYAHHNRMRMRITLVFGLALYVLAGIIDLHLDPSARNTLWAIRFVLIAPLIAAAMGVAFWLRRDTGLQIVYAVAAVAAGAGMASAIFLFPQSIVDGYTLSIVIILLYVYVVSGMRSAYALSCALLITAFYLTAAFLSEPSSNTAYTSLISLLAVVNLAGMFAAYRMEKEARRSFLHGRMVRLLNNEMVELVGVDELTGLANRRRFDEFFTNTWARAQRDKAELTLLCVDVDYLQLLNDHLGRHIGDICLRKLGAVIQHYRKRPGDLAARYEGEKFLVVLYACSERHGRTIAERLRQDIESLNLMNPASPAGWTVTVSIGVHTVVPTRNQSPASALLSADTLLYMAKQRGRNCVVSDKDAATSNVTIVEEYSSRPDRTLVLPRSEIARAV